MTLTKLIERIKPKIKELDQSVLDDVKYHLWTEGGKKLREIRGSVSLRKFCEDKPFGYANYCNMEKGLINPFAALEYLNNNR